ncbi:MAG: flagellar biosynthetic protein FliR, partial [bacterium]
FTFNDTIFYQIIKMTGGMFIIAAKIGGPLIIALLITSVALGLVARTVPQMNIFIVALPVKILGGLIFLCFCIPFIRQFIFTSFSELSYGIYNILNSIK